MSFPLRLSSRYVYYSIFALPTYRLEQEQQQTNSTLPKERWPHYSTYSSLQFLDIFTLMGHYSCSAISFRSCALLLQDTSNMTMKMLIFTYGLSFICHFQAKVDDSGGWPWHLTLRWGFSLTQPPFHQLRLGWFVMSDPRNSSPRCISPAGTRSCLIQWSSQMWNYSLTGVLDRRSKVKKKSSQSRRPQISFTVQTVL